MDVWSMYLYALKSPMSRVKYAGKLEKFFDFLELEGSNVEEKSKSFVRNAREKGNQWAFNNVLKFMQFQLGRVGFVMCLSLNPFPADSIFQDVTFHYAFQVLFLN